MTLIFHYHYQWNKRDERQRNEVAIREHLDYIDALLSKDRRAIGAACRAHLASAKLTLMQAVSLHLMQITGRPLGQPVISCSRHSAFGRLDQVCFAACADRVPGAGWRRARASAADYDVMWPRAN